MVKLPCRLLKGTAWRYYHIDCTCQTLSDFQKGFGSIWDRARDEHTTHEFRSDSDTPPGVRCMSCSLSSNNLAHSVVECEMWMSFHSCWFMPLILSFTWWARNTRILSFWLPVLTYDDQYRRCWKWRGPALLSAGTVEHAPTRQSGWQPPSLRGHGRPLESDGQRCARHWG